MWATFSVLFEFQCHIVLIRHCYFQLIAQILGIRTGQRSSVALCSFLYFIFCFFFCFIRVCLITFYFVYCIISIPRIDCINCIHLNLSNAKFRIKIAKEPGGSAPQKHCFQLTPLRRLIDCQLKYHHLQLFNNLVLCISVTNNCYKVISQ